MVVLLLLLLLLLLQDFSSVGWTCLLSQHATQSLFRKHKSICS
jgi:hypothetical protein